MPLQHQYPMGDLPVQVLMEPVNLVREVCVQHQGLVIIQLPILVLLALRSIKWLEHVDDLLLGIVQPHDDRALCVPKQMLLVENDDDDDQVLVPSFNKFCRNLIKSFDILFILIILYRCKYFLSVYI
jgi:hypothetical protein